MRTCPLGHTCSECRWHIRLRGTNPQTGQEVDSEDCAIAWLPTLLVENAPSSVWLVDTGSSEPVANWMPTLVYSDTLPNIPRRARTRCR